MLNVIVAGSKGGEWRLPAGQRGDGVAAGRCGAGLQGVTWVLV